MYLDVVEFQEVIFVKKYNYIVSVIMLALSGYIFYETGTYDIGTSFQKNPAIWPQFLAAALALLSVALIVETLFTRSAESGEAVIDWKSPGMKKVYIMLGTAGGLRGPHEDRRHAASPCLLLIPAIE